MEAFPTLTAQLRQYRVPPELRPEEKFEHWRNWYGSAVETPMRLERTENRVSPEFSPRAVTFASADFSLIEVHNEPVAASWKSNPDSEDLRLVYFRRAPKVTFCLAGVTEPVDSGCVRFLDVSHSGGFHAPSGLHAVQVNVSRSSLELDDASHSRLLRLPNLSSHPLVAGFVVPALMNWRHEEIDREAPGVASIFKSIVASLVSSLLSVPADETALGPAKRQAIRKYLRANYRNLGLGPDSVAERFNMSRRSLFHLFEREQLPMGAYLRTIRASEALRLLLEPHARHVPFAEIARASGFSDVQNLRRALKDSTGLTTRELLQHEELARQSLTGLQRSLSIARRDAAERYFGAG